MQGMATEVQRHIKRNSWLETDINLLLGLAAGHGMGRELLLHLAQREFKPSLRCQERYAPTRY